MLGQSGLPVWRGALKKSGFLVALGLADRYVHLDGARHLRLVRPHRAIAHRVLVPDASSHGVRLLHLVSDELAVDKTGRQDGDVTATALPPPGEPRHTMVERPALKNLRGFPQASEKR